MDGLAGRPYLASGLCFASEDIFRGIPDSHAGQESFTLYERYYTALPQLKSEHIEQMGSLFSANIGITVLVRDAQKINSPRHKARGRQHRLQRRGRVVTASASVTASTAAASMVDTIAMAEPLPFPVVFFIVPRRGGALPPRGGKTPVKFW